MKVAIWWSLATDLGIQNYWTTQLIFYAKIYALYNKKTTLKIDFFCLGDVLWHPLFVFSLGLVTRLNFLVGRNSAEVRPFWLSEKQDYLSLSFCHSNFVTVILLLWKVLTSSTRLVLFAIHSVPVCHSWHPCSRLLTASLLDTEMWLLSCRRKARIKSKISHLNKVCREGYCQQPTEIIDVLLKEVVQSQIKTCVCWANIPKWQRRTFGNHVSTESLISIKWTIP